MHALGCTAYGVIGVAGPGGVLKLAVWTIALGVIVFSLALILEYQDPTWQWAEGLTNIVHVAALIAIPFVLVIVGALAILRSCPV